MTNSDPPAGTDAVKATVVVAEVSVEEEEKEASEDFVDEGARPGFLPVLGTVVPPCQSHGQWRTWGSPQGGLAWWEQRNPQSLNTSPTYT